MNNRKIAGTSLKESQDALLLLATYGEPIKATELPGDFDKAGRILRTQAAQVGITLLWALTCLTLFASLIPNASADPKTEQYPINWDTLQNYQEGCALPRPYEMSGNTVETDCKRLYTGHTTRWNPHYKFHGEFCQTDFACLVNGALTFYRHFRRTTENTFLVFFNNEGLFDMNGWQQGGHYRPWGADPIPAERKIEAAEWPEDVYVKQFKR